jgi:hypothetical protein
LLYLTHVLFDPLCSKNFCSESVAMEKQYTYAVFYCWAAYVAIRNIKHTQIFMIFFPGLIKLELSWHIWMQDPNIKYENPSTGSRADTCRRTDLRMGMTEIIDQVGLVLCTWLFTA